MFNATAEIEKAFEENGVKCRISENEQMSGAQIHFVCENIEDLEFRFLSTDDNNDVTMVVPDIMRVAEGKLTEACIIMNRINLENRFVKLVLDEDRIGAWYDFAKNTENIGAAAVEVAVRFAAVIDALYPQLLETLGEKD